MASVYDANMDIIGTGNVRYTIRRRLSQNLDGADTYEAKLRGQPVFLKVYNTPSVLFTPWFPAYRSYQDEIIQRLRRLGQEVVQVLDVFVCQQDYIQVQEWADGADLLKYMAVKGTPATRPQIDDALRNAASLAIEVQHIHEAGIIHTDLKPENVYVHQRPGNPPLLRVIDFDVAILRDKPEYPWNIESGPFGTMWYKSLEHLAGRPLSEKSDIYTVGLIVCKLLTGINPLRRMAPRERELDQNEYGPFFLPIQSTRTLPRPKHLAPDLPLAKNIDDLLFACWHPDPGERPTAKQFYEVVTRGEDRPLVLRLCDASTPGLFVRFSLDDYRSGSLRLCQERCALLPGSKYLSSLANGRFNAYLLATKSAHKWFVAPPGSCKPTNVAMLNGNDIMGNKPLSKGDRLQIVDRTTRKVCVEFLVDFEDA